MMKLTVDNVNRASTMQESLNRQSVVSFVADHSQNSCVPLKNRYTTESDRPCLCVTRYL